MAFVTERNALAGRPVIFDSPVGWLGVAASPAGLRRVLLPNSAGRAARTAMPRPRTNTADALHMDGAVHTAGTAGTTGIADTGGAADMTCTAGAVGCAAQAVRQIMEFLRGERHEFELPLDLSQLSSDARTVLDELCASAPYGTVITYGELASRSGCPGGARAVGQIMARNPLPLVIPCHRVVAAGDLGGYGGGLALKRQLLRLEGALTEQLSLLGDI